MLRINRIKAISKTESGNFGFDYLLTDGLNLISSNINTRGILGITLNDGEIKSAVDSIDSDKIHIVDVGKHAFRKLS